jgi:hypothetical protein
MKLKSLILLGALCLGGSSFLAAKTRIFTVSRPIMCGNVQIPPGTYKLIAHSDGSTEIVDLNHFADKRPVSLPGTRNMADERFHKTTVLATPEGDYQRVSEIDLSHSSTKVDFPLQ